MLDDGNLTMQRRLSKGGIDGGTEAKRAATAPWASVDASALAGR
jgi:hypothetical protein